MNYHIDGGMKNSGDWFAFIMRFQINIICCHRRYLCLRCISGRVTNKILPKHKVGNFSYLIGNSDQEKSTTN